MMLGRSLVAVFPMKSQGAPLASLKEKHRQWSQGPTFNRTWETVSPLQESGRKCFAKNPIK